MNNIKVNINGKFLEVEKDGKQYRFELSKISKRLENATEEELKDFVVSASGYGIHWGKIDEDISIPSLLNEPNEKYGKKE